MTPNDVQRAIDKRTLLPGEDPGSLILEDAVHWISVYGELLTFKRSMLEAASNAMKSMTKDATRDVDIDQQLLRAQARRYVARQEFWVQRLAELEGEPPPDS